ncbi:MAG: C69 family dipeptidase [Muribaculaceae bacterium]|nr:C69 family dipeptidase [Muribaculaceae bacterium]
MKKQLFISLLALTAIIGVNIESQACTSLLAGKKATTDGSTLITYAADAHTLYGALKFIPAATHEKGSMREVRDWDTNKRWGEIPEAEQTYKVVGNMNEHQLTITESTWTCKDELVDTTGIIDYGSLIYITLQRAKTAREAIKIMTSLVAEYGYNSHGESFSIGDPNEIWVMEMAGKGGKEKGAVWVAHRIPDDCITGHANAPRIHTFPQNDKENCIYSKDVISFARKMGYFNGKDKDFDFAKAYGVWDFSALRGCDARVWAFFNRYRSGMEKYLPYINGDKDAEIMPLYIKPDKKVSVRDMQNMMRDHFEGTPFDMTQDAGAKIFWDLPYRFRPMSFKVDGVEYTNERAIATQQTAFVLVSQMRSWLPNEIGGIHWFGVDDANTNVFVPMYCCINSAPKSYDEKTADMYTLSWESAFWVNNWVANQAYSRYSLMIDDIRKVQKTIEDNFEQNMANVEAEALKLHKDSPKMVVPYLTKYSHSVAEYATAEYKKLGEYLLVKFLDGNRKKEADGKFKRNPDGLPVQPDFPGYNEEYLRAIVKDAGEHLKVTF